MKVKINYRSPVIWNIILFIFASFIFLYFQDISLSESSITDKTSFKIFFKKMSFVGILCGISTYFFFHVKRYSRYLFIGVVLSTAGISIANLFQDFSKLVLVILFFYLLIAYYFYQFFKEDIEESYYNSGFDGQDLFDPMLYKIECSIRTKAGKEYSGYLTNWSEAGCFVYFDFEKNKDVQGKVDLKITYEDNVFEQKAFVASYGNNQKGIGFKFMFSEKDGKNDQLGWNDFYGIIDEMGLEAGLLR